MAALAGVSNNSLNMASSLNATNALIQQQLGTLLAGSSVVLVSNLDENVSILWGFVGEIKLVANLAALFDNTV